MKIRVYVKANAKIEEVEKLEKEAYAGVEMLAHKKETFDAYYKVAVKAPAKEGKANVRVCELLAKHLGVAKSLVKIVRGHQSKEKVVEVLSCRI